MLYMNFKGTSTLHVHKKINIDFLNFFLCVNLFALSQAFFYYVLLHLNFKFLYVNFRCENLFVFVSFSCENQIFNNGS